MVIRHALLGALFALAPVSASAATFQAYVQYCSDGDTCRAEINGRSVRVRLAEIDAPETDGQPFSKASKRSLSSLVAGRRVTLQTNSTDRYGRPIVYMSIDGLSVNQEQVRRGWAWVYTAHSSDPRLRLMEIKARMTRIGLWADPAPIPPWQWRHRRG